MPDQCDGFEAERLQDIVIVQGELVHIADLVELGEVSETGRERRDHRMAFGQLGDAQVRIRLSGDDEKILRGLSVVGSFLVSPDRILS